MVQCWNFMPEERPSFAYCLHVLQSMHKKLSTVNQITSVHNQNYIYNGTSGSGSCITPDLPHSEAMLPGTAAGSAANIECRYSIGKKAGLIEVNSLRLLKPENLTSIDLNDCNICCDSTHDQDGYKLPVEVLGCI